MSATGEAVKKWVALRGDGTAGTSTIGWFEMNTGCRVPIRSMAVATVLFIGLTSLATSSAQSASLERTADGRIVISVLGEKLAFREKDANKVELRWPPYPCSPKSLWPNLAQWFNDPQITECLNKSLPTSYTAGLRQSVGLMVYLSYEDGRGYRNIRPEDRPREPLYPGALKSDDLPNPLVLTGQIDVRVRDPYTGLECLRPTNGPPDALGFEYRRGWHTLPASKRLGNTSKALCVSCAHISGWSCSVMLRSLDKAVSLSLSWYEATFHGPQPTWLLYDAAARKIAQSIFIGRDPGDVQ